MTDLLHVQIHPLYRNLITLFHSDGRYLRLRCDNESESQTIHTSIEKTRVLFQEAMVTLEGTTMVTFDNTSDACIASQPQVLFYTLSHGSTEVLVSKYPEVT